MNESKDILPHNDKDQAHGLWITYRENGHLWFKGEWVNDKEVGIWYFYHMNGEVRLKQYYI